MGWVRVRVGVRVRVRVGALAARDAGRHGHEELVLARRAHDALRVRHLDLGALGDGARHGDTQLQALLRLAGDLQGDIAEI